MSAFTRCLPLAVLVIASGCAGHILELSPRASFDEADEDAIIVLRVTPRAWVTLARGKVDRYGWRSKGFSGRNQFWSEGGFVVAKVTPTKEDEAYGIVAIRPEKFASLADEPAFTYATAMWSRPKFMVVGALPAAMVAASESIAPSYIPSAGVRLPVFKAVAGQVTYVGAIRVDASKDAESDDPPEKIGITPVTSPGDEAAVVRFMAKRYPKVRAQVSTGALRMTRRNEYLD